MPHIERVFCDGCGRPADRDSWAKLGGMPDNWRSLKLHSNEVEAFFCMPCTDVVMRQVVAWAVPPSVHYPGNTPRYGSSWARSDEFKKWFHLIMAAPWDPATGDYGPALTTMQAFKEPPARVVKRKAKRKHK